MSPKSSHCAAASSQSGKETIPLLELQSSDQQADLADYEQDPFDGNWQQMLLLCSKAQDKLLHIVLDLKYDLERSTHHSLIRSVAGRLKSKKSIQAKLRRFGFDVTPCSAYSHLHDIAGIRLICSYLQDIYALVDALQEHDQIEVLEIKDYIASPKSSGYRSVHVIVSIDVDGMPVECEIQLRTAAMDAWAALEHQLRYKQNEHMNPSISQSLTECSHMLFETDCRMQNIFTALKEESAAE